MKKILTILLLCVCSLGISQTPSYNPVVMGKNGISFGDGIVLGRNTLVDSLEVWLDASSLDPDNLTYNSSGQLVTYVNADSVVLDGSVDVEKGNSIRFGSATIGINDQIEDTLSSADSLILSQPFTGSVTNEFFWGGIDTIYDKSGNNNNATQAPGIEQLKLLWESTDSASFSADGIDDYLNVLMSENNGTEITYYFEIKKTYTDGIRAFFQHGNIFPAGEGGVKFYQKSDVFMVLVVSDNIDREFFVTIPAFDDNVILKIGISIELGGNYIIYLNGEVYDSGDLSTLVGNFILGDLTINSDDDGFENLNSKIEHFRVYSRSLSQSEIRALSKEISFSTPISYRTTRAFDGVYLAQNLNDGNPIKEYYNRPDIDRNLTINNKYVAFGWADFYPEDYEYTLPLLTKYGMSNTFYCQSKPISGSPFESRYNIDSMQLINNSGSFNEDHSFLHYGFMYDIPYADGYTYPKNSHFRIDRGDGTNQYNYDITSTVEDSWTTSRCMFWLQLPSATYEKQWQNLTDADCDLIRRSVSAFLVPLDPQNGQQVLQSLDSLSNFYCGTTGESVFSNDYGTRLPNTTTGAYPTLGDSIRGGIFQGAETTQNHEIWERIQTIMQGVKRDVYKARNTMTFWATPGGSGSQMHYKDAGDTCYFDTAHTQLAVGWSEFTSTIYDSTHSWSEIMRAFDYNNGINAYASSYRSRIFDKRYRQEGQREYKHHSFNNKIDYIGDGFYNSLRPFDNTLSQTEIDTIFNHSDDLANAAYNYTDTALSYSSKTAYTGNYSDLIQEIVKHIAWGLIPEGIGDAGSSTTVKDVSFTLFFEATMDFLNRANIEMISHPEAYNLAMNSEKENGENIFPNYNFSTTIKDIFPNAINPIETPDGWSGGIVSGDTLIIDNSGGGGTVTYSIRQYLVQFGELDFSANVKGAGTIEIKTIKNTDEWSITTGSTFPTVIITKVINSPTWVTTSGSSTISDASLVVYNPPTSPFEQSDQEYWQGYDNKICGFHIDIIVGAGDIFKIYNPSMIIN